MWPQVQGRLADVDAMGVIILETFGRLLGEIPPVPGPSLSGCPHLTTLVRCTRHLPRLPHWVTLKQISH